MMALNIRKILPLLLSLMAFVSACSSTSQPNEGDSVESKLEDLDVEDDPDLLGGINEEPTVEEGDEADFLSEPDEEQNFSANQTKENDGEMFANEPGEAAQGGASDPDTLLDPTTDPGAFAAENVMPDGNIDSSGFDQLLAENPVDPVASAAADAGVAIDPLAAGNGIPSATEVDPVGEGSAMTPPGLDDLTQTAEKPLPAEGQATTEAVVPVVGGISGVTGSEGASGGETIDADLASLRWVGYRIKEDQRELKVEVLTRGNPEFEIYEETNRAQQLELVIRFYQTKLRRKIRWSIDSSEFRSPVALIRMREFVDKGVVDVILTHRDPMSPQFYTKNGQILLVYGIPSRYFDQTKPVARKVQEKAQSLLADRSHPLAPQMVQNDSSKKIGFARPELFPKVSSELRPLREFMRQQRRQDLDRSGLPASFDKQAAEQGQRSRTTWLIKRQSLIGVAQDDLDMGENNVADDPPGAESSNNPVEGNNAAEVTNSTNSSIPVDTGDMENVPVETLSDTPSETVEAVPVTNGDVNSPQNNQSNPAINGVAAPPSNAVAQPPVNAAAETLDTDPISNVSIPAESMNAEPPSSTSATPEAPPSQDSPDVMGQSQPTENAPQYNGKPIFMEFYEAPLSLVLKSFSEETGNNFIYPAAIGQTPVTVHFKGVPWDEALKAILETYSMGMVRIGQNVVRIDQITNLTQYLQALEQAKQFETRRLPTKVLIFRLNNAVSKDVTERLTVLLARDMELDSRIKVSDDERTNSLVMEAPTHVLTKAKSIIERLDLETPQVEIASRIVEVQKTQNSFFGVSWANNFNFDPGRALGFGTLNFPNSVGSSFAVDPGVINQNTTGTGRFRIGSLNKFVDLDLLLRMEEKKGTTNVLQSNRVLVLDGQKASIVAGSSRFFRPAAGGNVINPAPGAGGGDQGLAEVKFNLELAVTPQVTALGAVIMNLNIRSDTPGDPTGEALADKSTRELETQMVRNNGDTGVIGGIYDTTRTIAVTGVPFLSDIPILGALFRSSQKTESQTELLIMVTPTIVSGQAPDDEDVATAPKGPGAQRAVAPRTGRKDDAAKF